MTTPPFIVVQTSKPSRKIPQYDGGEDLVEKPMKSQPEPPVEETSNDLANPPISRIVRDYRQRRHNHHYPADPALKEDSFRHRNIMVLSVYDATTQGWRTMPLKYDVQTTTDKELWLEIRSIYRKHLQNIWRRIFLFKKLRHLMPIQVQTILAPIILLLIVSEYTKNGVPQRTDPKDYPDSHAFLYAYHHPHRIQTEKEWVRWFAKMGSETDRTCGLEFKEGLWAEKFGLLVVGAMVADATTCIIWCTKGGDLDTVFTVMGFVLAAEAGKLILTKQNMWCMLIFQLLSVSLLCTIRLPCLFELSRLADRKLDQIDLYSIAS